MVLTKWSLLHHEQNQNYNAHSYNNNYGDNNTGDSPTRKTRIDTKRRIVSESVVKVVVNDPHAMAVTAIIIRLQLVQSNREVSFARIFDCSGVN